MFLKRLDIIGFKSFADKTTLEFSPGITGVVGPNGSGKSNIADAIRWVLGEQSARSLRGSKMEDVIFAGTEKRRSINYCEVSLTLDNADEHLGVPFAEVTVTRRVYRSGEGEYLINQQTCRLKDIHELFMDSGLGREAYSIIGQGRIEEMLSTRPEDRRGPFEDAAGIVKYRARRKESERRLDETSQNLVRVDDILAELERQAGPLEAEAKRATEYKGLSERWTALDISLSVVHIDALQARFQQAGQELEAMAQRRETVQADMTAAESVLLRAQERSSEARQVLESRQRLLLQAVEERERTEGQIGILRERLTNFDSTSSDRTRQLDALQTEIADMQEQHAALEVRLREVQSELERRSAELEVAARGVDPNVRAQLAAEVSDLNADLIDAHQQEATIRNDIRSVHDAMAAGDARQRRIDEERNRYETQRHLIVTELRAIQETLEILASERTQLMVSINEDTAQSRTLTQQEADVSAEISRLDSERASLSSKLELLRELEEGYDGFGIGVKTVLQAASAGRLNGVHGALATLMSVDKRYEAAIETALGGALQNIVVEAEQDARAAIEFLKRRQGGRATFMPIQVLKSRRLGSQDESRIARESGFVGIASDLVQADDRYRRAIEHVLGNVVVAGTLVDANHLAKAMDYRVRIVTLEGDVVNPGGIMSGGSQSRRGPGLLGRKRDREAAEAALSAVSARRGQKQQEQADLRDSITAISNRVREAQQELGKLQTRQSESEGKVRELSAEQRSVDERLQTVEWDAAQLLDGKQNSAERLEELTKAQVEWEQRRMDIETSLAAKRLAMAAWDESQSMAQERLTAVRVNLATMEQERSSLLQRRHEQAERLTSSRRRAQQLTAEMETLALGKDEAAASLAAAQEAVTGLAAQVDDYEAELITLRLNREQAEADVVAAEKKVKDAALQVQQVQESLHRAQVAAERIDVELNHALERLGEQYRMTYDWAKANYETPVDPDAAKREADSLRRRMDALSPVQLGAIDEWARLSERMEFLERERNDLREAEEQLRGVIKDIDEEMARRFTAAFEQIRQEFEVAFRQLFQGGRADLVLTDPEDVLHSGIDVIAQPPGKRLQNLNLLSGGERALTAMALLFAILRVRPVPFCVLDEVEAALDEANVGRFAGQLRRFSPETQFIVITHRRGTMEEVDSLYGVTMQESGVSSLISVRLADDMDIETA